MTLAASHKIVITFSIGPQRLAIPATDLREIIDPLPTTRVPGAGDFAPWVVNVRGVYCEGGAAPSCSEAYNCLV